MNNLFLIEKLNNDRTKAKELFNKAIEQFHFWNSLLLIESLKEKEEEIDLYLATANYKNDLSSQFKTKKRISAILKNVVNIDVLIEENNSIQADIDDPDLFEIFTENLQHISRSFENIYLSKIKETPYSKNDCYMQFKSSTGGKESENLCALMFKEYLKMLDAVHIDFELIDYEAESKDLLKTATIRVSMPYAYGFFKEEKGVHRFTRISPYGNGKLHTSFVFIDVYPVLDLNTSDLLDKNDVRVDKFRGSGAGGQHKNVTDSAIRLTHKPTGFVVKIENERSQHQNLKIAYEILTAKLMEKKLSDLSDLQCKNQGKDDIQDWGRQVRSYTIEQNRVKDHRTNNEYNGSLNQYFNKLYSFVFLNNSHINLSKSIK